MTFAMRSTNGFGGKLRVYSAALSTPPTGSLAMPASQTNTDRHSDTILIYQNLIPPKHRADDKRRGGGRATTVIRARPPPPLLLRPPSVRPSRRWHHVLAVSQSSIISLRSFLSSSLFLSSSSFELGEKSHQQRDHRRVDHLLPLGAD